MSGICGWIGSSTGDARTLAAMAAGIARGQQSLALDRIRGAAALHLDTTDGAASLLDSDRFLVAIDGYPHWSSPDLATLARERGHAEALLEAYRRRGAGLFDLIRGPFSFALLDLDAGEALLAVDRFGVHTMHYAVPQAGGIVFGSTAQSVREHPASSGELDPEAIYNYFNYFTVPGPATIYKHQRKLLPAQFVHCRNGRAEAKFYWQIDYSSPSDARPEELASELHELLGRATARTLAEANGYGVGAFLSGGLDSSTVAGFLAKVTAQPPHTFTVGFNEAGYDEVHFARIAGRRFGAEAHEHYLTAQEAVDAIPKIAAFYDEPFGNSSAVPTYYCARSVAEEGRGLALAGDGGDELFAGNARYAAQMALEPYFAATRIVPKTLVLPALGLLKGPGIVRRARRYLRRIMTPLPDRMLFDEHLEADEARSIFVPEFLRQVDAEGPLALARETYHGTLSDAPLHRMMHVDLRLSLADNDLRKVCTMCRMAGIRVRFPFLDEDLASFAAKIPADLLMKGGELRAFYKYAMKGFLPDEVINKKKHGFGMPYDVWIKDDPGVRAMAVDAAKAFLNRNICNKEYLRSLIEESATGDGRATSRIWDVMMLELWMQTHRASL